MAEKNEVAVVSDFQLPEISSNIRELIEEEMCGLNLSFNRIKVPSGGGLAFEVPMGDGETDIQKEILGVIVGHGPENIYYMNDYTGGNEPPDCVAVNGKVGIGNPGGVCVSCPYNEWGSDSSGTGKACQNRHKVFILPEGELFPLMLALPTTSVKNFTEFVKRNVMKGRRTSSFVTKVGLTKDKSKGGIEYSKCTFAIAEELSPEQATRAKNYSDGIRAMIGSFSTEKEAPANYDVDWELTPPPEDDIM